MDTGSIEQINTDAGELECSKATAAENYAIGERKQDWWDLRVNLRSMAEYEAMKQQPNRDRNQF